MSNFIQEMTNEEILQQTQLRKVIADAITLRDSLPLGRSFVADMNVPKEKLITILSFITNNIVNIRSSASDAIPVVVIQTCYNNQIIVLRFFDNEAKRIPLVISIDGPGADMDTFLSDRIVQFGFKEIKHLPFSETAFETRALWTRFHDAGQPPHLAELIDVCCDKNKLDEFVYFPKEQSLEIETIKTHNCIYNGILFDPTNNSSDSKYTLILPDFPKTKFLAFASTDRTICLRYAAFAIANGCVWSHLQGEEIPTPSDERLQSELSEIPKEKTGHYEVVSLEVPVPN